MADTRVITVEIAGQQYPIRCDLDPHYVHELAAYVERKMRLAIDAAPTSDVLGLAVLVALNLADEVFRAQQLRSAADESVQSRALRLEQLVDAALADIPHDVRGTSLP